MKAADADLLIVPGYTNSGEDHWQSRWQRHLSTARRVEQDDWDYPEREAWVKGIVDAVAAAAKPVVLIAHSLGVVAVVHAAPHLAAERVRGAFLVAMPDVESDDLRPVDVASNFAPIPRNPLPFPSILVASRSDPYCAYERAEDFGFAWGSLAVDAGEAGHLNTASGHGPWPEGSLVLARFLSRLSA